jgi:hypothetical protein
LQASRVTVDDGAFSNLRLMADGKTCYQVMLRGVPHCMPGLSAWPTTLYFDNASCDGAIALRSLTDGQLCAGQRSEYVIERKVDNCIENDSLFVATEDVTAPLHQLESDQCFPTSRDSVPGSYSFYHAGDEISAKAAPQVNTARVGTGALGLPCQTDANGVPLPAPDAHAPIPQNWLLENGRKCGPITDPDRMLRCVPYALALPTPIAGESGPFSDANCTKRVTTVSRDKCSNEPLPYPYFIETSTSTPCTPTITHAYLAAPYAGPLYELRGTACTSASGWQSQLLFVVGTEVDLASFPAINELTEQ